MKQILNLLRWMQGDGRKAALFASLGSAATLATAYYFQFVVKLLPCQLCFIGRKPHMVIIALGLIAFFMSKARIRAGVLVLMILAALAGVGISGFHVGVEHKWWRGLDSCSAPTAVTHTLEEARELIFNSTVVPCDEPAWVFLGISMAGWNGILYLMLAGWLAFAVWLSFKRP